MITPLTTYQAVSEEEKLDWMATSPDAIRLSDRLIPGGRFVCFIPDREEIGRWHVLAIYKSHEAAEAFCSGYCAWRDLHEE